MLQTHAMTQGEGYFPGAWSFFKADGGKVLNLYTTFLFT